MSPAEWIEQHLWVRHKGGGLIPFLLNPAQRWYMDEVDRWRRRGFSRFLVLKSRREGITTLEQALSYHQLCTRPHSYCVTLAQDAESTEQIFQTARLFHEQGLDESRPRLQYTNKRQLKTRDTGSQFTIGTAGAGAFGRGQTLQRCHASETAFWPTRVDTESLVAGLKEATSHGEMILETTANGQSGWYYETWKAAESGSSDFAPIFLPWYVGGECRTPFADDEDRTALLESLTDEEKNARETFGLTAEQLNWRRRKRQSLRKLFPQEYPETPGQAFLASGICFFDADTINNLYSRCKPPVETYENGRIQIYRVAESERNYTVGVDCSEGLPEGDYSAASIIDNETFEQVAELHGRWRPRDFADRLDTWCRKYNDAHLAIEKASAGHAVLDIMANERKYPRSKLFRHVVYDRQGKRSLRLGWLTNAETRPIMLNELEQALAEGLYKPNSTRFLDECRSFDLAKTGRYEAEPGYYDDIVIANAIAVRVRALGRPSAPQLVVG